VSAATQVLANLVALAAFDVTAYYVVFVLVGASNGGTMIANNILPLEYATSDDRPTYIAMATAVVTNDVLTPDLDPARLSALQARVAELLPTLREDLEALTRIPSVSLAAFDQAQVEASAHAVAELLRAEGLAVEIVREGGQPAVIGHLDGPEGSPTVMLYAHHDVQPPGAESDWESSPFEPTERDGRVYARGIADDKAGVMAHVAAVASYLRSTGDLPCNVKFVIEGEEEIGSENLAAFLAKYKSLMAADAVVLSDTSNFDTGIPGLTYRLRGMCQVDVEVRCLERPVHSGQRGGVIPDPVQILSRLIADLTASVDHAGRARLLCPLCD
jgi:acetylornithine deacetylase/succinyl-diaminopimelate desuccinylase-like protein